MTNQSMITFVNTPQPSQRSPIRDIDLYSIKDLLEYLPNTQPSRVVYAVCCACVNECQLFEAIKS